MTTSFAFLFFGVLLVAGIVAMAKIQAQELRDARAKREAKKARLDAFRVKSCRPDGD